MWGGRWRRRGRLFEHRAVVVGGDRDSWWRGLAALAGEASHRCWCGARTRRRGGQDRVGVPRPRRPWPGMGRQLYAAFPVFAEAFDAVVAELDRHLRSPLREVMWGDDEGLLE